MIEVMSPESEHHRRALARDVLERDAAAPGPPVRRPSRNRPVRQLVESIYSKRSEQSKTACQRKPTARLALSSSERRPKAPLAHLPTALRPSRPAQPWLFHQAEKGIDVSASRAI